MKKTLSLLLAAAMMLALLAGCGPKTPASSSSAEPSGSESAEPVTEYLPNLMVMSGPTGVGAAKLMADNDFYTAYTIPAGTYAKQDADVTTVTVKATLIVDANASEEDVYAITAAIFENIDAITAEHAKGSELSLENATAGMAAPFHAGAAKYFAEKGITVPTN